MTQDCWGLQVEILEDAGGKKATQGCAVTPKSNVLEARGLWTRNRIFPA